jgi:hypothetical protein
MVLFQLQVPDVMEAALPAATDSAISRVRRQFSTLAWCRPGDELERAGCWVLGRSGAHTRCIFASVTQAAAARISY